MVSGGYRVLAAVLALYGAGAAGCEREARVFRVDPSAAVRTPLAPHTPLQAGPVTRAQASRRGPRYVSFDANAWAMSEGKTLFSYFNCVGCHGNGGGAIGPPLMDDRWIYGSEPGDIYESIVRGRPNGMPAFRGRLADYQVWQLVAYVRSMSGLVPFHAAPGRLDDLFPGQPENSREFARGPAPDSHSVRP